MSKHDEARRAFLVGAAVAGAAAGAAMAPEVYAKEERRRNRKNTPTAAPAPEHQHSASSGFGIFFSSNDAATVAALTERIMPGAPGKPGARDADVLNYIDLALAGAYADLQDFYRHGLAALDAFCAGAYRQPFAQLPEARQDEVVAAMAEGKMSGFTWPTSQAFFNTVRTHTMEGMFADPAYGGNKDFAGWRLVGFPGAQMAFTSEDMLSREAFTRGPILGLQGQAKNPSGRP
jgi:gluconate 2-dehydrogenase gamma chain